jgi:CDP-diacylglycerol pyrophosphatase
MSTPSGRRGRRSRLRWWASRIGRWPCGVINPFAALADGLAPGDTMGPQTLAVVGITGADGRPGFALLAGRAQPDDPNSGSSEDLQDHAVCPPPADVIGK